MASLKKIYSFTSKKTIWRIIPTPSRYLVIEERDKESKQVFINCLMLDNGKVCFKNYQLDEKYWIGIEAVHNDLIFFHKFRKPDMPGHIGIYAFDIAKKKLIWQNDGLVFLLAKNEKIYAYQSTFEGRQYFILDCTNGKIIENIGSDVREINRLREESMQNDFVSTFKIPQKLVENNTTKNAYDIIRNLLADRIHIGDIYWLEGNDIIMFNHHEENQTGNYYNYFNAYDVNKVKIILKKNLNCQNKHFVTESFFIVENLLFLLIEKSKLVVYRIMQ